MWSLGPHCHSLLRGYRFRNAQWESDFQSRQHWALVAGRVYAVVVFLRSCSGVSDTRRYSPLQASLVLHFIILGWMPALFVATFCSRPVQRHILPVLTVTCCALAGCHWYIMAENVQVWGKYALLQFRPLLANLPPEDAARQRTERLICTQQVSEAVYMSMMWSLAHWIVLSVLGCGGYTVCSFLVVYISLSVTLLVDPDITLETALTTIVVATLATGAFFTISVVMERLRRTSFLNETLLTRELQASQMADSMLNHTLKNLLADVAANIEVFLAGSAPNSLLEDSVTRLRQGMVACKERQVYLKLVSGEYMPVVQEVSLRDFGQRMVAGRGVQVEAVDLSVHLDSTICSLILENALSNAFRHGNPEDPCIRLLIEALDAQPPAQAGFQRIRFTVENAADPDRPPLTPEDAERLFHGQAHLVSNVRVPTLSDRVGIVHCVLAAQVGGVALSLTQAGNVVRFSAELDALVVPRPTLRTAYELPASGAEQEFPPGLRFCCLDDSPAALRLLELHLQTWWAPSEVHLLGHREEDVHCFVSFALQNADVVILDQHLEYSQTYLGTDLVRQLCDQGFPGLLCIRSANDAAEDRERFRRAGAHCCFGKDQLGSRMMEELKVAYVQLQGNQPTAFLSPRLTTGPSSASATLPAARPTPASPAFSAF